MMERLDLRETSEARLDRKDRPGQRETLVARLDHKESRELQDQWDLWDRRD